MKNLKAKLISYYRLNIKRKLIEELADIIYEAKLEVSRKERKYGTYRA